METNNNTWMTHGKHGNDRGDWPLSIVVFEDDPYHFRLLQHHLTAMNPNHEIMGPLTTTEAGKAFFSYHQDVDLIIADISLSDGLVFDALAYAPDDIPVIFTTAHKDYALEAFRHNSLCYLLKPISERALAKAIKRTMPLIRNARHDLGNDMPAHGTYGTQHRHDFLVKTATGERRVYAPMLRYVASENKSTYLHLIDGESFTLDLTLEELARQLDPVAFMRVNRKYVVPKEQVRGFEHLANGRIRLELYGDACPEIIVSRTHRNEVCEWLEKQ